MKDKQIYRNLPLGQLSDKDAATLVASYQWVAEQTARLIYSLIVPVQVR